MTFNGTGRAIFSIGTAIAGSGAFTFNGSGTAHSYDVCPDPFFIHVGDYGIEYAKLLIDQFGQPLDLTNVASVKLHVGNGINGVVLSVAATVVYSFGHVSYTFQAKDFAAPGFYVASWEVTFNDGQIQSSPPGGWEVIIVLERLTAGPPAP